MLTLNLKISQQVTTFLRQFTQLIVEAAKDQLCVKTQHPLNDPELLVLWNESLLESLHNDCEELLKLLENPHFGNDTITLSPSAADSILRGCAAVRLKLHQIFLTDIPDEILEEGGLDATELSQKEHQAYILFMFLASLQEMIIAGL